MQICVCIFFREGDLQLNGLMIKAMIKAITWFSFFFFFFIFPSDTVCAKSEVLLFEGHTWPVKFVGN